MDRRLLAAWLLATLGCGGASPIDPEPEPGTKRLVATATTVHAPLGSRVTLPVSVVDENGNVTSLAGVTFTVGEQLVADVSDAGLLSALEPGNDTVVVKLGEDSVAIQIVVDYPDGITHPQGLVG